MDTNTLIDHLNGHIKNVKQKPNNVTADAGYGSEENYQWLEKERIIAYVKHNQFDRVQNETIRNKNPFTIDQLTYDEQNNQYIISRMVKLLSTSGKTASILLIPELLNHWTALFYFNALQIALQIAEAAVLDWP